MVHKNRSYHFIGIGGIGMSALARILLDKKISVTGSDISSSMTTQSLIENGAQIYLGHSEMQVPDDAIVIYSTDIREQNPEFKAAQRKNCSILHRSDLLRDLMKGQKTLAVAGTHGKTTTSSLLASVLDYAGMNPSFAVGGLFSCKSREIEMNGKYGTGEYFVAEADESDGTFLKYPSFGAIITNAEPEHLNHFGTEENMYQAFEAFINNISSDQHIFLCNDDPGLKKINSARGLRYGFQKGSDIELSNFKQMGWKTYYDLSFKGVSYSSIEVPLIGEHNALNSAAVFAMSLQLGVSESTIREAFKFFKGVGRRCQKKAEVHNVLILDDYGHHPTEIFKTISAIRAAIKERRLVVIFQPHRYSRTKDCLDQFAPAFDAADVVFINDLYSAREIPIEGISEQSIIKRIQARGKVDCRYLPTSSWLEEMLEFVRPHDVIVTLGAGSITTFGPALAEKLQKNGPKKIRVGVISGGKSCEHEISLMSADFVKKSLNPAIYEMVDFYIDKLGKWHLADKETSDSILSSAVLQAIESCDLLMPILHGNNGEDGTIQGFFEILGKPYIGADFRSAAICMDKVLTKKLARLSDVPVLPFIEFGVTEWRKDRAKYRNEVSFLKFPVFVKPVHLGSSIGVAKVEENEDLESAIENAFLYDTHIIIEEGVVNPREIEFAILGNEKAIGYGIDVPPPGEICAMGKVYDYQSKYGEQAFGCHDKAPLSDDLIEKGKTLALKAYQACKVNGFARVDFFLDENHSYWFNEINPIPGCTKISLYPTIWNSQGYNGSLLIDRWVILALHRYSLQNKLKSSP